MLKFLIILGNFVHVPMGILRSKVRSGSLPLSSLIVILCSIIRNAMWRKLRSSKACYYSLSPKTNQLNVLNIILMYNEFYCRNYYEGKILESILKKSDQATKSV